MPEHAPILERSDFDFMSFDRVTVSTIFWTDTVPKSDLQNFNLDRRGEARAVINGLTTDLFESSDGSGRKVYRAVCYSHDLNWQRIAREILTIAYKRTEISQYLDLCNEDNFVPVHIRRDKGIPLNKIFSQDVPAAFWSKLQAVESRFVSGLKGRFPKTTFHFQCHAFSSFEVALDVVRPPGTDFGVTRDIDFALAPLILKKKTGAYANKNGNRVPHKKYMNLKNLRRSWILPGWPSFSAETYTGYDLEVYVKQDSDPLGWLQRFEAKFREKEIIKTLFDGNSFKSYPELLVKIQHIFSTVWDELYGSLGINCYQITDQDMARATMVIRYFHPKHSDKICRAMLGNHRKVSTKLWYVSEEYIKQGKDAGVFKKTGPQTRSADYIFDWDCLDKIQVKVQTIASGKNKGKQRLNLAAP